MTTNLRVRRIGKMQYKPHVGTHPGVRYKADPEWGQDKDIILRVEPGNRIGLRDVVKSNSKHSRMEDDVSRKMMQRPEREKLEEKNFGKLHGYMIDQMAEDREDPGYPDYRKQKTTRSKKPVTKKPVRKVVKKKVVRRMK